MTCLRRVLVTGATGYVGGQPVSAADACDGQPMGQQVRRLIESRFALLGGRKRTLQRVRRNHLYNEVSI